MYCTLIHVYLGDLGLDDNPSVDAQRRDILLLIPVRPIAYKLGNIRITKVIFARSVLGFVASLLAAVVKMLIAKE